MQPAVLKHFDRVLGRLITALLPSPAESAFPLTSELPRFCSILVIRPGGIGDAILLLPTIRALKEFYPEANIDVLAEKRNGGVFSLSFDINKTYFYDRLAGIPSVLKNRYDLVIDTEQWHRLSAVVAGLTRAPVIAGFGTNDRKKLFTNAVAYDQSKYESESFLDLVSSLGAIPAQIAEPFVDLPVENVSKAAGLLADLRGRRVVAIFPGASIPERRWGADCFRRLSMHLHRKGIGVTVVGGAAEKRDAELIVSGGIGLNLAGRTTLAETAAIIDRSALLVSGDSGILHIAVGLGKPTVSLFGPGIAEKWAPRGPDHIVINKNLPCSPCTKFGYTPRCPRNAECMTSITVEEVAEAVFALLDRQKHKPRPEPLPEKEIA